VAINQLQSQLNMAQAQIFEQGRMMQAAAAVPRMSPTLERMPLPSDREDWSRRPKRAPSHQELYQQLYGKEWSETDNVVTTFPNPYQKKPHMDYPHSSIWLEGDKIMGRIFQELGPERLKFIVEAGSMHGGSAIRMAMELDKRGLRDVPILCIDPWTGDLNMWLNRIVWEHLDVRDGRATTYDQFMINVKQAITDGKISNHHISPFPVSSIVGARWLQATGFQPQLVYLDSAHEIDETYYELCLYWNILEPGGILMGDDYGWMAVRVDVDRFVKDKGLTLNMFGVYYNWFLRKPG
jgi:cephalosporin hydroxylase